MPRGSRSVHNEIRNVEPPFNLYANSGLKKMGFQMRISAELIEKSPRKFLLVDKRTKVGKPTRKRSEARATRFIAMTEAQKWRNEN